MAMTLKELRTPTFGCVDEVVFVNTGMEFPPLYGMRDKLIREELIPRGVRYTEIQFPISFVEMMTSMPVYHKDGTVGYGMGFCNTCGVRWGTNEKLRLMKEHIRNNYPKGDLVRELIGIAYDEADRCEKDNPHKAYPLVSNYQMTEAECLRYCYANGYDYSYTGPSMEKRYLYDDVVRASCICCGAKRLSELKAIYRYMPKLWDRLRGLQMAVGLDKPMKSNYKLNVFQLEERFKREIEIEDGQTTIFDFL